MRNESRVALYASVNCIDRPPFRKRGRIVLVDWSNSNCIPGLINDLEPSCNQKIVGFSTAVKFPRWKFRAYKRGSKRDHILRWIVLALVQEVVTS